MAELTDIFARVNNYQRVAQSPRTPDMSGYQSRLQGIRDQYWQKKMAEQQRAQAPLVGTARLMGGGLGGLRGGGGGADAIDRFMAAISGQESGGDYNVTNRDSGAHGRFQIMPANWGPWSREAGLGPNAPRTAANQDLVARYKMQQYFNQTGRWDLVARMWYAGPGSLNYSDAALNRAQGGGKYPSINAYVQSIMRRMGY